MWCYHIHVNIYFFVCFFLSLTLECRLHESRDLPHLVLTASPAPRALISTGWKTIFVERIINVNPLQHHIRCNNVFHLTGYNNPSTTNNRILYIKRMLYSFKFPLHYFTYSWKKKKPAQRYTYRHMCSPEHHGHHTCYMLPVSWSLRPQTCGLL